MRLTGDNSQTPSPWSVGGGVDVVITKDFSWRFFEADYMMTSYSGSQLSASARQNNFRIGSGLVVRWDYPPAPPKPNHPPVAACSAAVPSVYQGSTDVVAIHVNASDPDNDPITYSYTATGGSVDGTGPDARWNPSGSRWAPTPSTSKWTTDAAAPRRAPPMLPLPSVRTLRRRSLARPNAARSSPVNAWPSIPALQRSGWRSHHLQLRGDQWPDIRQHRHRAI